VKYRFKEKLLFVPSYSGGHQIGENLVRELGFWINLRMKTVASAMDLALKEPDEWIMADNKTDKWITS